MKYLILLIFLIPLVSGYELGIETDSRTYELSLSTTDNLIQEEITGNSTFSVSGRTNLTLAYDDVSTGGYDLYYKKSIFVDRNLILNPKLSEIGSLRLMVRDKGPVKGAFVRTICDDSVKKQRYYRTDGMGIVEDLYFPTGECLLRVAVGDDLKEKEFTIKQGEFKEIKINFAKRVYYPYFLILLAVVFILFLRKKRTNLADFGKKERAVLEFMINNLRGKPEEFYMQQSQIAKGVGLAKTSTMRIVEKLEEKGDICIVKEGKSKRIFFSEKFLKNHLNKKISL